MRDHSLALIKYIWDVYCVRAEAVTNPGAVWEQVQPSCQVLVYVFWPTLYINTVCDLVRVYLSLFRCYLGQFQCGNLVVIRCTPQGAVPVWELLA